MTAPRLVKQHVADAFGLDHRRALIAVRELLTTDLPWLEQRAVLLARANGASWGEVGRSLRRSRQAVRQRYLAVDGTPPPIARLPVRDDLRFMAIWNERLADVRRRHEFDDLCPDEAVPW